MEEITCDLTSESCDLDRLESEAESRDQMDKSAEVVTCDLTSELHDLDKPESESQSCDRLDQAPDVILCDTEPESCDPRKPAHLSQSADRVSDMEIPLPDQDIGQKELEISDDLLNQCAEVTSNENESEPHNQPQPINLVGECNDVTESRSAQPFQFVENFHDQDSEPGKNEKLHEQITQSVEAEKPCDGVDQSGDVEKSQKQLDQSVDVLPCDQALEPHDPIVRPNSPDSDGGYQSETSVSRDDLLSESEALLCSDDKKGKIVHIYKCLKCNVIFDTYKSFKLHARKERQQTNANDQPVEMSGSGNCDVLRLRMLESSVATQRRGDEYKSMHEVTEMIGIEPVVCGNEIIGSDQVLQDVNSTFDSEFVLKTTESHKLNDTESNSNDESNTFRHTESHREEQSTDSVSNYKESNNSAANDFDGAMADNLVEESTNDKPEVYSGCDLGTPASSNTEESNDLRKEPVNSMESSQLESSVDPYPAPGHLLSQDPQLDTNSGNLSESAQVIDIMPMASADDTDISANQNESESISGVINIVPESPEKQAKLSHNSDTISAGEGLEAQAIFNEPGLFGDLVSKWMTTDGHDSTANVLDNLDIIQPIRLDPSFKLGQDIGQGIGHTIGLGKNQDSSSGSVVNRLNVCLHCQEKHMVYMPPGVCIHRETPHVSVTDIHPLITFRGKKLGAISARQIDMLLRQYKSTHKRQGSYAPMRGRIDCLKIASRQKFGRKLQRLYGTVPRGLLRQFDLDPDHDVTVNMPIQPQPTQSQNSEENRERNKERGQPINDVFNPNVSANQMAANLFLDEQYGSGFSVKRYLNILQELVGFTVPQYGANSKKTQTFFIAKGLLTRLEQDQGHNYVGQERGKVWLELVAAIEKEDGISENDGTSLWKRSVDEGSVKVPGSEFSYGLYDPDEFSNQVAASLFLDGHTGGGELTVKRYLTMVQELVDFPLPLSLQHTSRKEESFRMAKDLLLEIEKNRGENYSGAERGKIWLKFVRDLEMLPREEHNSLQSRTSTRDMYEFARSHITGSNPDQQMPIKYWQKYHEKVAHQELDRAEKEPHRTFPLSLGRNKPIHRQYSNDDSSSSENESESEEGMVSIVVPQLPIKKKVTNKNSSSMEGGKHKLVKHCGIKEMYGMYYPVRHYSRSYDARKERQSQENIRNRVQRGLVMTVSKRDVAQKVKVQESESIIGQQKQEKRSASLEKDSQSLPKKPRINKDLKKPDSTHKESKSDWKIPDDLPNDLDIDLRDLEELKQGLSRSAFKQLVKNLLEERKTSKSDRDRKLQTKHMPEIYPSYQSSSFEHKQREKRKKLKGSCHICYAAHGVFSDKKVCVNMGLHDREWRVELNKLSTVSVNTMEEHD